MLHYFFNYCNIYAVNNYIDSEVPHMTSKFTKQNLDILELYKYQSKIERLDGFLNQQLWLSSLAEFKDPFEGAFILKSDPSKLKPGTAIFDHHYNYFKKNINLTLTQEQLIDFLKSQEFIKASNENETLIKDLFSNHGVFCFTYSNTNIPMWAHYANDHQGYCVNFEINFLDIYKLLPGYSVEDARKYKDSVLDGRNLLSFHTTMNEEIKFVLTKVRYLSTAPEIYLDKFLELKDEYQAVCYIIQNSMGTKFDQWAYENEFRLIVNANSLTSGSQLVDLKIYAPFLTATGVIMGAKMSAEDKTKCRDLCRKYNVKLYQAECSDYKYEITVDLVKDYSIVNNRLDTQLVEIT